jgi:hypothetical protein
VGTNETWGKVKMINLDLNKWEIKWHLGVRRKKIIVKKAQIFDKYPPFNLDLEI